MNFRKLRESAACVPVVDPIRPGLGGDNTPPHRKRPEGHHPRPALNTLATAAGDVKRIFSALIFVGRITRYLNATIFKMVLGTNAWLFSVSDPQRRQRPDVDTANSEKLS